MAGIVLFVDDDEANLVVCEAALGDSFDLLTERDPRRALDILRERDVAVLIADQRMPEISGVELCSRAAVESPDTIRILITAYSDLKAAIAAINQGQVRRYLKKPWEPEELAAEIRDALAVRALKEQLDQAEARLRHADRLYALAVMSAGLAHEIRNPLSWLSGNVDWLSNSLGALFGQFSNDKAGLNAQLTEIQSALSDLGGGVHRIAEIVASIDKAARLPESEQSERVDLVEVVDFSLRLVNAELKRRARIEVYRPKPSGAISGSRLNATSAIGSSSPELAGQTTSTWVVGSSTGLSQIVTNLVVNALQAMSARPRNENLLSITIDREPDAVILIVQDNGPGIPESARSRIFKPFFTTKGAEGTGLGLSISSTIARQLGGSLNLEPTPGDAGPGGARFVLRLQPAKPSG